VIDKEVGVGVEVETDITRIDILKKEIIVMIKVDRTVEMNGKSIIIQIEMTENQTTTTAPIEMIIKTKNEPVKENHPTIGLKKSISRRKRKRNSKNRKTERTVLINTNRGGWRKRGSISRRETSGRLAE
jgi:hypothetical protein